MTIFYFLLPCWEVRVTAVDRKCGEQKEDHILYCIFILQSKIKAHVKTTHLIIVHINSNQKNKFRQEKAAAEVFVNCRSSALNFTEEPECENAHGEANQRNNYS